MTRAGEKLYDIPDPPPVNWGRVIQAVCLVAAIVLFYSSLPGD